jgi:hypothetical protein
LSTNVFCGQDPPEHFTPKAFSLDSTYHDTSSLNPLQAAPPLLVLPQFQDSSHYFYNPCPLRSGENIVNLGISIDILPEAIVEQEVPAPVLDLQFKHGFSPVFSFYSDLSSNYYTNVVEAGIQWNTGDDGLSFAVGSGLNGFAGSYSLGGEFDNTTAAALAYVPIVEIGHKFGSVAMSLHLAADYVFYAQTHISSLYDNGLQYRVNDIWATLTFEQPFYGNTRVSTGISVTYSRTPYQIWMLFDSFDEYVVIPEFFFSFEL